MAGWLERKAPAVHRFLTRRDRPWPLVREFAAGILVLLLLGGALYGLTGQPLSGGYPVVVVTTGSMMHCEGFYPDLGGPVAGKDCTPTHWGRLGTIDPGDLVFVRHVSAASDVIGEAEQGGSHYGKPGDVIVYRQNGDAAKVPIIHRALFWVEINDNLTYSVAALGLDHVPRLDARPILDLTGGCDATGMFDYARQKYGASGSGFATRGDNNPVADQCGTIEPARLEWVLGKARGELPWVGLVNLAWGDFRSHCTPFCNYDNAGADSKTMLFALVAVLLVTPWVAEFVLRRRRRRRASKE